MASQGFLSNIPVKLRDINESCADPYKLRIFLLKSGLLGDYSGVCKALGETMLSKENSFKERLVL